MTMSCRELDRQARDARPYRSWRRAQSYRDGWTIAAGDCEAEAYFSVTVERRKGRETGIVRAYWSSPDPEVMVTASGPTVALALKALDSKLLAIAVACRAACGPLGVSQWIDDAPGGPPLPPAGGGAGAEPSPKNDPENGFSGVIGGRE